MSVTKLTKRLAAVLLLSALLAAPGIPSIADSLTRPTPPDLALRTADGRSAVRDGVELERSRQWLKAIEHYEDAVKRWPESKDLQYGLRRSKIHFGINRRYADSSFERLLLAKSRNEALNLFDGVLSQIQANYVDALSTTALVAHGTESLYLALANDKFARKYLRSAAPERIRRVRKILRERYWNKPLAGAASARRAVAQVCDVAQSVLGLPAAPVVMEYIFGGCNCLDDYSNFLTPDRLDDLYGNIEGEFVGLGIEMKAEEGRGMLLVNVLPESPAEAGRLRPGDHIVGIDGADCRRMTTDEAARLLRGQSGSRVRLKVQRDGVDQPREGEYTRKAVHVRSIPIARIVDKQHGIGYIRMTGFQKTSVSELDDALWRLRKQGMRSLIWDVRGNPGGLLTAAVEVLDRFIEGGVLVSTRGRTRDQNWTYSARRSGTWKFPLVLLVDGDSASASEIVAGAVRDHKRGTIVGRQTYGKWSVQSIFPVRDSTGLRLTTAKFYSPAGKTLGKIGVKPDVMVETGKRTAAYRSVRSVDVGKDPDLKKGLEVLRAGPARRSS